MRRLTKAAQAIWEFIVGDDWITAAGVVAALGVTAAVASTGTTAWPIMPLAVVAVLALSLARAAR